MNLFGNLMKALQKERIHVYQYAIVCLQFRGSTDPLKDPWSRKRRASALNVLLSML